MVATATVTAMADVTVAEMATATATATATTTTAATATLEAILKHRLCNQARGGYPGQQVRRAKSPSDGGRCPVGLPRTVMIIKHPDNPKSVCRCIPTVILLQDESQDFKCAGINQVKFRFMPG